MHLTIIALGSRGDVQPYTALGRGLRDAGYAVRVVSFENFEPMVRQQGLEFEPVKGDAQAILDKAVGAGLLESGNVFSALRSVVKSYGALLGDYIEAFSSPRLQNTDAIIDQLPGSLFGYDLAEKLNVPHLIAAVIPMAPTRAWAWPVLSLPSFTGWYNHLTYSLVEQLVWRAFRPSINRFRKRLGLPPSLFFGPFNRIRTRRDPVIHGFSPRVIPPPPDWGAHIHTRGYWLLKEDEWQPPDDLTRFLEAGSPPVFIGFGSMTVRDPQALTTTVLEAARLAGQRLILSSGWGGIGGRDLPDYAFPIEYAPYDWLFPRMAAIVHHGGSGTTGLGLRSGVPSLVVPFGVDQPFWGKRVAALGAGPKPVPFKRLTATRLAEAIRLAVTDDSMRKNAAALGAALRAENGLADAVSVITDYLNKRNG
jgi:UDP:flavonoid glycosyltransferase YjiC (YdhE family)